MEMPKAFPDCESLGYLRVSSGENPKKVRVQIVDYSEMLA